MILQIGPLILVVTLISIAGVAFVFMIGLVANLTAFLGQIQERNHFPAGELSLPGKDIRLAHFDSVR